jgi:hypothetical protein
VREEREGREGGGRGRREREEEQQAPLLILISSSDPDRLSDVPVLANGSTTMHHQ